MAIQNATITCYRGIIVLYSIIRVIVVHIA